MEYKEIQEQASEAVRELLDVANLKKGDIFINYTSLFVIVSFIAGIGSFIKQRRNKENHD